MVSKGRFPLEACLTSNVKCRTVTSYSDHHFLYWFSRGHPLCICTDDKGVFATTLSEEYLHAANAFNLSKAQLLSISRGAIDLIFADDAVKASLHEQWEAFK
ncbi:adenosine deaminase-like protein [Sycon ciliatum]|uniref:adenosine deaminase-like protein n=1 Tax=Sycon ciliatum TaxID=27933 RepID=UPI0031F6CE29